MNIIDEIKNKVKDKGCSIVLPESDDIRTLKAAEIITNEGFAKVILIGKKDEIDKVYKMNCDIEIIDPKSYEKTNELINEFYSLRKHKGITMEQAKDIIENDYLFFGNMLVKMGYASGLVAGASHSSADVLRPALQIIKTKNGINTASSFFLMDVPNCEYGEHGVFIYSDCGMNQNPTSAQLADIAYSSAKTFESLVGEKPIVAFLSHSTYGSSKHADVDKVVEACKIAKEKNPDILMDGELQFDAAVVPSVANKKAPSSKVAGRANVLIFPDLDSANIAYKITERLAKAHAYGPITQGLDKPVNDLSRGCNEFDIVGAVAITCMQV